MLATQKVYHIAWRATESHRINENSLFFFNFNFQSICHHQIFLLVLATILTHGHLSSEKSVKNACFVIFIWLGSAMQITIIVSYLFVSNIQYEISFYLKYTKIPVTMGIYINTEYWPEHSFKGSLLKCSLVKVCRKPVEALWRVARDICHFVYVQPWRLPAMGTYGRVFLSFTFQFINVLTVLKLKEL